jgi:hypothetical protein
VNSTTSALFEAELRTQVAAAEAGLLESLTTDDPILIESARGHLDGLINLAQRNGLQISTTVPADRPADLDLTEGQPAG